jgi:hypothetical protein
MSTVPTAAPVAPEPSKIGAFGRLFGVLFSPGETFADIARKPGWIVPWLFLTITGLMISYALVQKVDWVQAQRTQMERVPMAARQFEQMTPEQRDQALQRGAAQAKVMRYVRGAIGSLLLMVIMGGIYLGLFNAIGGAGINYKMALTMTGYGYVPMGLRELIGALVVFIKPDPGGIDPENFLASNAAAFLPDTAPLWQIALGASFDVFGIWCIILLAMGFAASNPKKVSFGKAMGIVLGVFFVFLLFGLGVAAIFS